ncbi:MAG: hypothetical protein JW863_19375 [Chitinispirillaceae bacterium]|nr:hypothetical protein [Chitinispirillaceae bacterium]
MNCMARLLSIAYLFGSMAALPLQAASSWTLFGLDDEVVNTIITLSPGNGDDALMVGTSKGIWNHEYGHWLNVWEGLPVRDMRLIDYNMILAAAGNGSDSDGIYLGKVIAIGEPGNLWQFTLLQKAPHPTAVEYLPMPELSGGRCNGTLFAANASGVFQGTVCSESVEGFSAMTTPSNPWGTGAALLFSTDNTLWAGGNYGYGDNTLVSMTASLLRGTGELTELKKLNITSMAEYTSQGDTLLAAATVDSGIQVFRNGVLNHSLPPPAADQPIVSIVPFPTIQDYGSGKWTMLLAATPKSIYRQCPPTANCIWGGIGTELPAAVRCIAQYRQQVLWAGTDAGVYRYEYSTAVRQRYAPAPILAAEVRAVSRRPGNVGMQLLHDDGLPYSISLFDLRGRCVRHDVITGQELMITGLAGGVYHYRLSRNTRTIVSGGILCR